MLTVHLNRTTDCSLCRFCHGLHLEHFRHSGKTICPDCGSVHQHLDKVAASASSSAHVCMSDVVTHACAQGDFTVLASEPLVIVGVDVAAPDQLRPRGKTPQKSCKAANTTTNAPIPIIVDTTFASMDTTTSILPTKAPPPLVNPPNLNPSLRTSNPQSTMACRGAPVKAATREEEEELLQSMALLKSQFSGQEWDAVLAATGRGVVHMYAVFQRLWSLKEVRVRVWGLPRWMLFQVGA